MDDDKKGIQASDEPKEELDLGLPEEKEDTSKDVVPSDSELTSLETEDKMDEPLPVLQPIVSEQPPTPFKKESWFKRFWHTKKGKVIVVILVLLAILGVLYAVPATRYGILGTFIKKEAKLAVVDSKTNKPVTQADVKLGTLTAKTDSKGLVDLRDVPVGEYPVTITKKNYKDTIAQYTVPVFTSAEATTVHMEATGRQVTVTVVNVVTKKPLKDATVTVDEASSTTDEKGEATMVLPADKQSIPATIKGQGYNDATAEVKVTDQADANKISLTPSGSLFFLSKATGKINVMKANLDGTSPTVVVQGTGNEQDSSTALLAARDWRYMALFAKRKSNVEGQLYLVDAKSTELKTIDEGNVEITLVGWSGHNFIYVIQRNDVQTWQSKRQALKSYNAETGKITILDETTATGNNTNDQETEYISDTYILENKLVYVKGITRGAVGAKAKKPAIMTVSPEGGQSVRAKEFDFTSTAYIDARLYEPQEVYFRVQVDASKTPEFYEYEGGSIKSITSDDGKFYNSLYPTYLVSPNGQKTLWHESRNGKNALFVGDKNGANAKELASASDFTTYGWFGDGYILLAKNKSELYIASVDGPVENALKITNYHKPSFTFDGYGYGYGGL
jgi:hypothetical protein